MKEEAIKQFLTFEKNLLNNTKTFFPVFEAGFDARSKMIWKEYIDWQDTGGKMSGIDIKVMGEHNDILIWQIGEETYAQRIDKLAPFSIEQYKRGLTAVLSFMKDRPQYFKFRKLEGMFNPLRLLLYKFI